MSAGPQTVGIERRHRLERYRLRRHRLAAHYRTVVPAVRHRLRPEPEPESLPWSHAFEDPETGTVRLTGRLSTPAADAADARPGHLVLLVHGLGGSIDSHYMAPTARGTLDLGLACLRVNLRGADRQPGDFYHAGLSSDLAEILRSPALDAFERIDVVGFSLGGHLTLKFATEVDDPRVGAVAAVCSPLDLSLTVLDFDALPRLPYREYIVGGVRRNMARVLVGQDLPGDIDLDRVRRVKTLRQFDAETVVRRFGFDDPDHYYRTQSVVHRLDRLRVPSLLLAAAGDPMISADSIRAAFDAAPEEGRRRLQVAWSEAGGHVGFPPDLDVHRALEVPSDAPKGLAGQVVSWLLCAGR